MDFIGKQKNAAAGGGARELARIALFVALLSVSSFLSFPLPFSPVPVTGQTIILDLIALSFTPKQVFKTMSVYVLAGAAGLPVFARGSAGIGVLIGPSGGYLWGFLIAAVCISILKGLRRNRSGFVYYFLITLAGIPVVYLFGVLQLAFVASLDFSRAITVGVLPFIPGDIFKCAAASFIALAAEKTIPR